MTDTTMGRAGDSASQLRQEPYCLPPLSRPTLLGGSGMSARLVCRVRVKRADGSEETVVDDRLTLWLEAYRQDDLVARRWADAQRAYRDAGDEALDYEVVSEETPVDTAAEEWARIRRLYDAAEDSRDYPARYHQLLIRAERAEAAWRQAHPAEAIEVDHDRALAIERHAAYVQAQTGRLGDLIARMED